MRLTLSRAIRTRTRSATTSPSYPTKPAATWLILPHSTSTRTRPARGRCLLRSGLRWSALLAANTWPVRSALRQSYANLKSNCYFFTYSYTYAHSDSYGHTDGDSNSNAKTYTDTESTHATTSSDSVAEAVMPGIGRIGEWAVGEETKPSPYRRFFLLGFLFLLPNFADNPRQMSSLD